jgi:hypothetical protein
MLELRVTENGAPWRIVRVPVVDDGNSSPQRMNQGLYHSPVAIPASRDFFINFSL